MFKFLNFLGDYVTDLWLDLLLNVFPCSYILSVVLLFCMSNIELGEINIFFLTQCEAMKHICYDIGFIFKIYEANIRTNSEQSKSV